MRTIEPVPTRRAVVDPLRKCNLACLFCYYKHNDMESVKPWDYVKAEIDGARDRGNEFITVTGGEPTMHPDIFKLVEYSNSLGMPVEIITNGIINEKKLRDLVSVGVDSWMISMHGIQPIHDELVQLVGARQIQNRTMSVFKEMKCKFRVNSVMTSRNQDSLVELTKEIVPWGPMAVNFIAFNPHHEWATNPESTQYVPNMRVIESLLNESIKLLEAADIGVNVRYLPMCRIKPEYRRTVCNDLQVAFDPWEWDYHIQPKIFDAFFAWCKQNSVGTEHKGEPCCSCDLFKICGGINKYANQFTEGRMIDAVTNFDGDKNDFYFYRKHNLKTL